MENTVTVLRKDAGEFYLRKKIENETNLEDNFQNYINALSLPNEISTPLKINTQLEAVYDLKKNPPTGN